MTSVGTTASYTSGKRKTASVNGRCQPLPDFAGKITNVIVCDNDCPPDSVGARPGGTEIAVITGVGGSGIWYDATEIGASEVDTTVICPSALGAPKTVVAVAIPTSAIAGATKPTRENQRFMALTRGWTVTGLWR